MGAATRKSDERLLDWLRLADQRVPAKEIARRYNTNPRNVERALYLVRKDDREAHAEEKNRCR